MSINSKQLYARASRRLAELEQHLYSFRQPIQDWQAFLGWPSHLRRPACADAIESLASGRMSEDMIRSSGGTTNVGYAETEMAWLSTSVVTPEAADGSTLRLRLLTAAEGTLYLDGKVWHGIDENHNDIVLADPCSAGTPIRLDLMIFGGRDRRAKTVVSELAVRNDHIAAYRSDLRAVVGAARSMQEGDTVGIRLWQAIEASLDAIDFHSSYGSPDISHATRILAKRLHDIRESEFAPSDVEVYMTGNSHIDVTWLWTLAETRFKMGRTTATALRMMEQYPEYRFAQSQAQLYDYLRTDYPDLFSQVGDRIRDGQWEIAGATWVEPDCNVVGGESLVRQILYSQAFWRDQFDREADVLWLPDTFGYSSALPQICRKSGLRSFVTQKLTWNDVNPFPHGHFDWEGIDGSRIRCTFPQIYVSRTFPEDIARNYDRYPSKDIAPDLFYLYGYGDGGGGPVPEDLDVGTRLTNIPGFPKCSFTSAAEALHLITQRADRLAEQQSTPIPVWRGELYLEFHRGTLTTHGRMKRSNRKCERALREVEVWSSIASALTGFDYPAADLESAWKKVLLNQFHDTLPGTSVPAVYPEAHAMYDEVFATTDRLRDTVLGNLIGGNESDSSFGLVNSLSWSVIEWTEVAVLKPEGPVKLVDENESEVPFQITGTTGDTVTLGFEATVPGFGHSAYRVVPGDTEFPDLPADADVLQSDRLRITFSADGTISSVFDKELGREWLAGPGNEIQAFDDRPDEWEAWNLSESYERRRLDLFSLEKRELVEVGPARSVMRLVFSSRAGSRIEQDVVVYKTIPRVDFQTRIDWQEQRVLLKTAFPLAVFNTRATYEIQFGSIERPTHRNTSWDAAKFEVCGHTWADLSESNGGVSLLNDCKYGYDAHENVLRLTLLRNAAHPDPRDPSPPYLFPDQEDEALFTDTGVHEMTYSLYPHAGDWRNGSVRQAHSMNNPLRVVKGPAEGLRPCVVSDAAVVIETLKQAEDGSGFILRVYEAHGGRRRVSVDLPFRVGKATCVDLMERPNSDEGEVEVTPSGGLAFDVLPYEIRSFRVLTESSS